MSPPYNNIPYVESKCRGCLTRGLQTNCCFKPQVNLAFGESSKLVVQEPAPPSPPEELQVATSFNS